MTRLLRNPIYTGILLSLCTCHGVMAASDGYFLPCKQKAQLVWQGRVAGADGGMYDIRLIPGYAPPARYAWRNIKEAGTDLREYVESDKYSDLWDTSGDCLEWAYDDCLADFAFKGSGRAWKRYFSRARTRTQKRVFGWWLSYPWAFMQSTVDNVVRIPVGLCGTAIGTVGGVAVVPAYHLVDSSVKAVWNGGVEGVAAPVIGMAWNTVAAPPLSLLGQQPSAERVDGFWVRQLGVHETVPEPGGTEVRDLAKWGARLGSELADLDEQRRVASSNHNAFVRGLREQIQVSHKQHAAHQKEITQKEREVIRALAAGSTGDALPQAVFDAGWTPSRLRQKRQAVRRELSELGLSSEEADRAWNAIYRHCPNRDLVPSDFTNSTDPVRTSIKAIKDID